MNENLKAALDSYIKEGVPSILVTGDKKLMGILESYPEGVKPSIEEVQAKYEGLLNQDTVETKTDSEPMNPLIPEGQSGSNIVESPNKLISNARKKALTKSLTLTNPDIPASAGLNNSGDENISPAKLNSMGYANIVLMSIIVMIIVAIICVFIFL